MVTVQYANPIIRIWHRHHHKNLFDPFGVLNEFMYTNINIDNFHNNGDNNNDDGQRNTFDFFRNETNSECSANQESMLLADGGKQTTMEKYCR